MSSSTLIRNGISSEMTTEALLRTPFNVVFLGVQRKPQVLEVLEVEKVFRSNTHGEKDRMSTGVTLSLVE